MSTALAVLGVMTATLLVGWFGFSRTAEAVLSVGGFGFAYYIGWQLILFVLLGIAWAAIVPPGERRVSVFVWGRMVRDAAASCLPFSQLGGYVLGARAVALHGVRPPTATISTAVDLTAELVAQILFLLIGLVILLTRSAGSGLSTPVALGLGAAAIVFAITLRLQPRAASLFVWLIRRVAGKQFLAGGTDGAMAVETDLARLYENSGRLTAGTALHLIGWCGKGVGNWIAFRLLGTPMDMAGAIAIEGLLHALLAVAFLVPGYAGVQEAGYAGLGALFGATPEISLAVSLLRRARDLAVGIPILLIWQLVEVHRIRRRASPP